MTSLQTLSYHLRATARSDAGALAQEAGTQTRSWKTWRR